LRPSRTRLAEVVQQAWRQQHAFAVELVRRGEEAVRAAPADAPVWIICGRPYNLYDERCNLHLASLLARMQVTAVPFDCLDVSAEPLDDFPNMYWGSGSRVLRVARRIARTPGMHGVFLSNFGCGVDSFLEHFYRHLVRQTPSLFLELDEHTAEAGLRTRLEAYRSVVHTLDGTP
jgi:predicted nucleotide-binding protein (sugar kinase/HSP70/actin superfamily)